MANNRDYTSRTTTRPVGYGSAWLSWIIFILGIWEIFAPWIWGYAIVGNAVGNDVILGILIVIFAAWGAVTGLAWPSWVNLVLGIWLIIAPSILNYSFFSRAAGNDIVVGIVVAVVALIAGWARSARPVAPTAPPRKAVSRCGKCQPRSEITTRGTAYRRHVLRDADGLVRFPDRPGIHGRLQ